MRPALRNPPRRDSRGKTIANTGKRAALQETQSTLQESDSTAETREESVGETKAELRKLRDNIWNSRRPLGERSALQENEQKLEERRKKSRFEEPEKNFMEDKTASEEAITKTVEAQR